MKHLPRVVLLVLGLTWLVGDARAAAFSPEVHQDGRVTFRVRAPKADKVLLLGDWLKRGDELAMTQGEDGVWTSTAGPFPPGNHIYGFEIDGVQTPDPENASVKLRASRAGSFFHIPGEALWQPRDVPHGNVDINFHESKTLGDTRWFSVYTPPDYDRNTEKKYPVLYLLHGSNDTAIGWVMIGAANFIMDNLIADAAPPPPPTELQQTNTDKFEAYLLNDVLPVVERKYRVLHSPRGRAIAGYSMGGGQAITIGLRNLDKFSAIGSFSGAVPSDRDAPVAEILSKGDSVNDALDLFWIGCGRDDFLLDRNESFDKLLQDKGIEHQLHVTDGVHNFHVWRQYLATLTPQLFRETARPVPNERRP